MLLLLIIECNYNDFFVGFLAKMKVLSRWIEVSTERWKNPQKTTIFTTISSQRQFSYTFFNGNITFSLKTDYLRGIFALCCNTIQCVGYLDLMEVHYNSCFCSLTHWPIGTLAHRHWFTFRNSANETHWTEERESEKYTYNAQHYVSLRSWPSCNFSAAHALAGSFMHDIDHDHEACIQFHIIVWVRYSVIDFSFGVFVFFL